MARRAADTSIVDMPARSRRFGSSSDQSVSRGRWGISEPTGTLIVITLIGGVDGLSVLVPHGDPAYRTRRPDLAVGPPGERDGAIDLGRGLGLHPALAPLHSTFGRSDRLAIIGGVGIPDRDGGGRRHLPSREFIDRGGRHELDGWAARLLQFEGLDADAVWSFGPGPHPMFDGLGDSSSVERDAISLTGAGGIRLTEPRTAPWVRSVSSAASRWSDEEWTTPAERLRRGYPDSRLSRALATTADMLRSGDRLRLVAIDDPGYDTHVDQGDARSGVLTHKLGALARSLAAFWADVTSGRASQPGRSRPPVTVVLVSEFGRTIDDNGSGGTEHGRGGVALALGDQVVGGVHGDMPDLHGAPGRPASDVWPVTIDIRRVLADATASHGFRPWRAGTFPQLSLPNRSLGLLLSP